MHLVYYSFTLSCLSLLLVLYPADSQQDATPV